MEEQKRYVVGFLMDPLLKQVVLISKLKPEWQKGLLNGVGGKVGDNYPDETAEEAMHREFKEEAGVDGLDWKHYLTLETPHSHISFFRATGNVHSVSTQLEEQVGVYDIIEVMDRCDVMPNLRWCIQMARTFYFGERADKFEVREIMEPGVRNSMGSAYNLGSSVTPEVYCKHCGSNDHRTPLNPDTCETFA